MTPRTRVSKAKALALARASHMSHARCLDPKPTQATDGSLKFSNVRPSAFSEV